MDASLEKETMNTSNMGISANSDIKIRITAKTRFQAGDRELKRFLVITCS